MRKLARAFFLALSWLFSVGKLFYLAACGIKIVGWWPLAKALREPAVRGYVLYMALLILGRYPRAMLVGELLKDGRIVLSLSGKGECGWVYEAGLTLTPTGVIKP